MPKNECVQLYIPPQYLCPITQLILRDPVIASDDHCYEKDAIQLAYQINPISPLNRIPLKAEFYPNHALKQEIERFLALHPALFLPEMIDTVYIPRRSWRMLFDSIQQDDLYTFKKLIKLEPRLATLTPLEAKKESLTLYSIDDKLSNYDVYQFAELQRAQKICLFIKSNEFINSKPSNPQTFIIPPEYFSHGTKIIMREEVRLAANGFSYQADLVPQQIEATYFNRQLAQDIEQFLRDNPELFKLKSEYCVCIPESRWDKLFLAIRTKNLSLLKEQLIFDPRFLELHPLDAKKSGITVFNKPFIEQTLFEYAAEVDAKLLVIYLQTAYPLIIRYQAAGLLIDAINNDDHKKLYNLIINGVYPHILIADEHSLLWYAATKNTPNKRKIIEVLLRFGCYLIEENDYACLDTILDVAVDFKIEPKFKSKIVAHQDIRTMDYSPANYYEPETKKRSVPSLLTEVITNALIAKGQFRNSPKLARKNLEKHKACLIM